MSHFPTPQDLDYAGGIPGVDVSKIGRLMNAGVHHRVFEYGKKYVIKIPRRRFYFLYSTTSHLDSDLTLLKEFFPGLLVETELCANSDHTQHCIIQKKITKFEKVTPATLSRHWSAYQKLVDTNKTMMKTKRASLDFLGGEGVLSCVSFLISRTQPPFFSNMVLSKGKFFLLDSELLRFSFMHFSLAELLRFILSFNSYWIAMFCVKLFHPNSRAG